MAPKQPIGLFQDVIAIAPGTGWEKAIDGAISKAAFFIPTLPPPRQSRQTGHMHHDRASAA